MEQRYISNNDLSNLTASEITARWMNEETYQWLLRERDRLIARLNDAPSNSPEAINLINEVSLVGDVLDCYEQHQAALAEAA